MKRCSTCRIVKPVSDFYQSGGRPVGRCKACTKEIVTQWAKNNPERRACNMRRSDLRRTYGLSEADVARMLAKQDDKCPICCEPLTSETLRVDHDHSTGKVRGLLCNTCNLTIGLLKDDPEVIRSAIRYVSQRRDMPDGLF